MIKTNITGTIHKIGPKQTISDDFCKKQLLLDTKSNFNPILCVDFFNAKIDLLDSFKEGQEVTVFLDVYSNESKKVAGQYFNNITGWKIVSEESDLLVDIIVEDNSFSDELPF